MFMPLLDRYFFSLPNMFMYICFNPQSKGENKPQTQRFIVQQAKFLCLCSDRGILQDDRAILLAVSFTKIYLRLAFYCWKREHYVVFGDVQKKKC